MDVYSVLYQGIFWYLDLQFVLGKVEIFYEFKYSR